MKNLFSFHNKKKSKFKVIILQEKEFKNEIYFFFVAVGLVGRLSSTALDNSLILISLS
jgi:hypothetical protein